MCRKKFFYPEESTSLERDRHVAFEENKDCCCRAYCNPFSEEGQMCRDWVFAVLLVFGVVGGVVMGLFLTQDVALYLGVTADIILAIISCFFLPFVITCIISGASSLQTCVSMGLVGRAVLFYLGTTLLAVLQGFVWIFAVFYLCRYALPDGDSLYLASNTTIHKAHDVTVTSYAAANHDTALLTLGIIRNLIPARQSTLGIMRPTILQFGFKESPGIVPANESILAAINDVSESDGLNLLCICIMSLLFSFGVTCLRDKAPTLVNTSSSICETTANVLSTFMWLYPVYVMLILAAELILIPDTLHVLQPLALFLVTVLMAQICHMTLTLSLLYLALTRKNPCSLLMRVSKALLTAAVTSSSELSLPCTVVCLERYAKLSPTVSRVISTLGACVNRGGLALYWCMLGIYLMIRNNNGDDFHPLELVIIGIVALLLSISVSLLGNRRLIYILLLHLMGIPPHELGLVLSLDWIMCRVSSVVDVWSDCICAGILDARMEKTLEENCNQAYQSLPHSDKAYLSQSQLELERRRLARPPYTLTMINEDQHIIKVSRL